jgi:hypothetical protein
MIRRSATALALSLALLLPTAVQARSSKPPKPETLKKGPVSLNPAIGYVLVRLGPKAPTSAKPDPISLSQADPTSGRPYTKAQYAADKYLARTSVALVVPGRSFLDAAGVGVHIVSVYPGRWYIASGGQTCFSLGTYAFDVKPGEITDIGTVLIGKEDGRSPVPEIAKASLSQDLVQFGVLMNIVMSHTFTIRPAIDGDPVPEEVKSLPIKRATLIEDYRFDNSCQTLVSRAASLPPLGHQPPISKIPEELLAKP